MERHSTVGIGCMPIISEDGPWLVRSTDGRESGIKELVLGCIIAWDKQALTWFNMNAVPGESVFFHIPVVCRCCCWVCYCRCGACSLNLGGVLLCWFRIFFIFGENFRAFALVGALEIEVQRGAASAN